MNDQHKSQSHPITKLSELRHKIRDLQTASILLTANSRSILQEKYDFEMLAENSSDIIVRLNQSMKVLFVNSLGIEILGINLTNYAGKTPAELNIKGNYHKLWNLHLRKTFITRQPTIFEAEFTNYKGRHFYYRARFIPEFSKDGAVQSVLCTIRNISEFKKAISDLRASEQRSNILLAAVPDLLIYLSNEGIYLDLHTNYPSLLYKNIEDCLGQHISQVLPFEVADKIMVALRLAATTGKLQIIEYQLTINNILYFFECRLIKFNAASVLGIVQNISELTRLKQELSRLDQLHLVGEMAASIGHEVRNPMTTVRGYLQLFCRKPEFTNYKDTFTIMIGELDRANAIISEFLSLSKSKALQLKEQNLNTIIRAIAPLIQSTATLSNKYLKLELELIPDLFLDDQEIRQLILNLTNNGLEAMLPDQVITIKTFMNKDKVVMAIQDMGTGIPSELMDKLGTPFFTTKEHGTGLGLTICYSIIARHKATVEVVTSPQGTTFLIIFDQG